MMNFKWLIIGCFYMLTTFGWAANSPPENKVRVDLFISSTCPYCHKAEKFFQALEVRFPWLDVHHYIINKDKAALLTFYKVLKQQKSEDFIVPSAVFCNTRWVGFNSTEDSGKQLLKGLHFCYEQLAKHDGKLPLAAQESLKQMALASKYENSITTTASPNLFVPMIAGSDALFSSTSFIIFILMTLWIIEKRRPIQIAGIISGLLGIASIHYLQQAYTTIFYKVLTHLWLLAIIIGLLLFVGSLRFREQVSKKTGPWLLMAFLITLCVESYQQTSTPNFSLIFSQWMLAHAIASPWSIFYSILYQIIYVSVLGILTIILVLLLKHGRYLKTRQSFVHEFAWQYLLLIGLILMVYPFLFAYKAVFYLVLLLSILLAWWKKLPQRTA